MKPAWSVNELAEQGGYVIHEPTGTVGRAKKVWSGDEGDAWTGVNGAFVKAPVLELDTGDAFVLKEDAFTPLTVREVQVFETFQKLVTSATEVAGRLGAAAQVPLEQFARLGAAVLRVQQVALERAVLEAAKAIVERGTP